MKDQLNRTTLGMNLDSVDWQVAEGQVTYALNANIQSGDGNRFAYTNESSNEFCLNFPTSREGLATYVVGILPIIEDNVTVYFLVDDNGNSTIGYTVNKDKSCVDLTEFEKDCGCHKGVHLSTSVQALTSTEEIPCDSEDCYWYVVKNNDDLAFHSATYIACDGTSNIGGTNRTIITPLNNELVGFAAIKGSVELDSPELEILSSRFYSQVTSPDCQPLVYVSSNCCNFNLVYDDFDGCKLNFKRNFPIRATYKKNNCETLIYFGNKKLPTRKFSLYNINNSGDCGEPYAEFDCNKARVFPEVCHPSIRLKDVVTGGQLKAGVYQISLAYSSKEGFEYTDYFDLEKIVPIFERPITDLTSYTTDKAIEIEIDHNTDLYDYFNVVVAETVDNVTNYYLQGVYKTPKSGVSKLSITGNWKESFDSVKTLVRNPFYYSADIITTNEEVLMLGDLIAEPQYNLQRAVNNIKLYWETVELVDGQNDYSNPIIASDFRSYERDEVYAFGIQFQFKTGKYSKVYPLANREPTANDLELIISSNNDVFTGETKCDPVPSSLPKWKVYNTAGNGRYVVEPGDKVCGVENYMRGEFGYYESEDETYPCNSLIWSDALAGQKLRLHKFPDSLISHIHNNANNIYPIGVRVDTATANDMLKYSVLDPISNEEVPLSSLICGFKLVRSNRVNNKSVLAKGLLYDVGVYEPVDEDGSLVGRGQRFYPNYPFNDTSVDPFISTYSGIYDKPDISNIANPELFNLDGFKNTGRRFTFHSPNTHFSKPTLGVELKLETEEYGNWRGHFQEVLDHPKYRFLTKFDSTLAMMLGIAGGIKTDAESDSSVTVGTRGTSTFDVADSLTMHNLIMDIFKNAIPLTNYATAFHAVAEYNNYVPVANSGFKRRPLEIKSYLSPIVQDVRDDYPIHNFHRESSVYFKIDESFSEFAGRTRSDNSRVKITDRPNDWSVSKGKKISNEATGEVSAYYASNKRFLKNQYGSLENIQYLDTGAVFKVDSFGKLIPNKYPAFGGDVFINKFALKRKQPFFTQNMVGRPDQIDFNYQYVPNLGYPIYYIGTAPDELELSKLSPALFTALVLGLGTAIISATSNAAIPSGVAAGITSGVILQNLIGNFIAKNNLDDDRTPVVGFNLSAIDEFSDLEALADEIKDLFKKGNTIFYQSGFFYLHSIGIANFYVESDVNLAFRHGRNIAEENFYPNVGEGIPDDWLQEKNVPVARDNTYIYNKTYSKQSYENYREPFTDDREISTCEIIYPNRVIYSDSSNQEENYDAWCMFKTNNYFDFPKTNGKLINLVSGDNAKLFAMFENSLEIYNTTITLNSDSPYVIEAGTGSMFANKPQEIMKSDSGYLGTQHKSFLVTQLGSFFTDAKKGKIYHLSKGLEEISSYDSFNWFRNHLPFKILDQFPNADIDNNLGGLGLTLAFDPKYERILLTKLDYELKSQYVNQVLYDEDNKVFRYFGTAIEAGDPIYFYNRSFTIGYHPASKKWVSFYSFLPRYYVTHSTYLQSGRGTDLWNHNMHSLSYQTYYNTFYPYHLEYTIPNNAQNQMVNDITLIEDILEYTNDYDYYSLLTKNNRNYNINFTKAIVYNQEQSTGILKLVESPINNLFAKKQYPRYTPTGTEILYSKQEGKITFNHIYDNVINQNNGQSLFTSKPEDIVSQYPIDKVVNTNAISYDRNRTKKRLNSTMCRIRLINDLHTRYKFINHFEITNTTPL